MENDDADASSSQRQLPESSQLHIAGTSYAADQKATVTTVDAKHVQLSESVHCSTTKLVITLDDQTPLQSSSSTSCNTNNSSLPAADDESRGTLGDGRGTTNKRRQKKTVADRLRRHGPSPSPSASDVRQMRSTACSPAVPSPTADTQAASEAARPSTAPLTRTDSEDVQLLPNDDNETAPRLFHEARVNDSTAAASVDGSEAVTPHQQQRDPSAGTCPFAGKNSVHAFMKSIPTNQMELSRAEAEFVRAMKAIDVGISSARLRPGKGDLNGHVAFAFVDFNTAEDADRCFNRCVQKRVPGTYCTSQLTQQPRWVIELRMWDSQADIIVDEKKDEGRPPHGPGGPNKAWLQPWSSDPPVATSQQQSVHTDAAAAVYERLRHDSDGSSNVVHPKSRKSPPITRIKVRTQRPPSPTREYGSPPMTVRDTEQVDKQPEQQQQPQVDVTTAEYRADFERAIADCLSAADTATLQHAEFEILIQRHATRFLSYTQLVVSFIDKPSNKQTRKQRHLGAQDRSFYLLECLLAGDANTKQLFDAMKEAAEALRTQPAVQQNATKEVKEPVCKASVAFLETERVFVLKKPSVRFASAVYFCRVCDYHINSASHARTHITNDEHRNAIESLHVRRALQELPGPSVAHAAALTTVLRSRLAQTARTDTQLTHCQQLADALTEFCQSIVHKDCRVRLYGSCRTGVALASTNVNLELLYPDSMNHAQALITAAEKFKEYPRNFVDLREEYTVRWPCVRMLMANDDQTYTVVMSVRNELASNIAELLRTYTQLSDKYRQLCALMRDWAKECGFDDYTTGGLPPYALDIMCLHYLQQAEILPVLHKDTEDIKTGMLNYDTDTEKILASGAVRDGPFELSTLWLGLLRYYAVEFDPLEHVVQIRSAVPITREAKAWGKKKFAIEDPFLPQKNLSQLSNGMYDYIQHCVRCTYMYFAIPRTEQCGALFEYGKQSMQVPEAYLRLLPAVDLKSSPDNTAASPQQPRKLKKSQLFKLQSKGEQPPQTAQSTAPVQPPSATDEDAQQPPSYSRQLMLSLQPDPPDMPATLRQRCQSYGILTPDASLQQASNDSAVDAATDALQALDLKADVEVGVSTAGAEPAAPQEQQVEPEASSSSVEAQAPAASVSNAEALARAAAALCALGAPLHFEWHRRHFTADRRPELQCAYCGQPRHSVEECPDKQPLELCPLPKGPSPAHNTALTKCLYHVNEVLAPNPARLQWQREFVYDVQRLLQSSLTECKEHGCQLDLFGSSVNGFGFNDSDCDLCLRFECDQLPENVEPKRVIRRVARLLARDRRYFEVWPVCGAKVPIVKFKTRNRGHVVEADISLYNSLALRNTNLMRTYAAIDPRVPVLGRMLKCWARQCGIGDASKGSLSSYAYVLMLIHYLQRVHPLVLPVLQELWPGNHRPTESEMEHYKIDGWYTYFYEDIHQISSLLDAGGRNACSVAELWLGFFRYYTEVFNFDRDIVQIRRAGAITKFEKLWTDKPMCIEDPFDHNHNLSAALSKRMFAYIRRSLVEARRVFGVEQVLHTVASEYAQQWRTQVTVDVLANTLLGLCELHEEAPRDRQCKMCHRVGHYVENCPYKRGSRSFLNDSGGSDDEKENDSSANSIKVDVKNKQAAGFAGPAVARNNAPAPPPPAAHQSAEHWPPLRSSPGPAAAAAATDRHRAGSSEAAALSAEATQLLLSLQQRAGLPQASSSHSSPIPNANSSATYSTRHSAPPHNSSTPAMRWPPISHGAGQWTHNQSAYSQQLQQLQHIMYGHPPHLQHQMHMAAAAPTAAAYGQPPAAVQQQLARQQQQQQQMARATQQQPYDQRVSEALAAAGLLYSSTQHQQP